MFWDIGLNIQTIEQPVKDEAFQYVTYIIILLTAEYTELVSNTVILGNIKDIYLLAIY